MVDEKITLIDCITQLGNITINEKNGKKITDKIDKFSSIKSDSVEIGRLVSSFNTLKGSRIINCGSYLEFEIGIVSNNMRLSNANFCRDRLCPMCQWRSSMKVYAEMQKTLQEVERTYGKYKYLFLTLTVKNCKPNELKYTVELLINSFSKMCKRKLFKDSVDGHYRNIEITYNASKDEFHPHLHCILAVKPSYFSKKYVKKEKWEQLWKSCLCVDYVPIMDIRTIDIVSNSNAVSEVTKYTYKSNDILTNSYNKNVELLQYLLSATYKKRLTVYGGILKKARSTIKNVDIDNIKISDDNTVVLDEKFVKLRFLYDNYTNLYMLKRVITD